VNPEDLIEAAPAIAKGAGAPAAAIPFTDLADNTSMAMR
jgi:hypothetical protein